MHSIRWTHRQRLHVTVYHSLSDNVIYCNIPTDLTKGYTVLDINEIGLVTCKNSSYEMIDCNV